MLKKWSLYLSGLIILLAPMLGSVASALSGSQWKAGNIIADSIFANKSSLSVNQIQAFLNQKVGTGPHGKTAGECDTNGTATSELGGGTRAQYGAAHGNPAPFTCLKDYWEVPKTSPSSTLPASNYGGKPRPSGSRSAARLIWDAAQAYNISPKVLLVTIQKESVGPLITDDWPFKKQYTYAMGAHCPDGPNGAECDPNYSGFSLQIRESARLFRYYLDNMDQPWWSYKKPGNNSILYNPNRGCGSSNVNIASQATAALYTYTPYQPNPAALKNLYGTGDSCSSYGNRNFWRMYNDWFGSTLRNDPPPRFLAADFNGDGKSDIGFRRLSTGEVFIKYGNGSGSFGSQTTFTWAGGSHFEPLAADFNGDGKSDIALRRISTGQIYIRYGNGSGSFGSQTTFTWAGGSHFQLLADDVNGNNKSDLILRRVNTGEIYIRYGNGSGGFGSQRTFNWAGGSHFQPLAADFNNNGKSDIALRRSTGEIYIRYGNGSGSFGSQTTYIWYVFY